MVKGRVCYWVDQYILTHGLTYLPYIHPGSDSTRRNKSFSTGAVPGLILKHRPMAECRFPALNVVRLACAKRFGMLGAQKQKDKTPAHDF